MSKLNWNTFLFLVMLYGAIAIVLSFMVDNIGGHVLQASLSFTGATSGPILGVFIMGIIFPFANATVSLYVSAPVLFANFDLTNHS